MANFYYIIITLINGEKQVLEGQLNWLSGPIPGAHKKLKKLLNTLQIEKDTHWIKDFSVGYES
jgi:hypothetical protein